jgi:hypothetical protein
MATQYGSLAKKLTDRQMNVKYVQLLSFNLIIFPTLQLQDAEGRIFFISAKEALKVGVL